MAGRYVAIKGERCGMQEDDTVAKELVYRRRLMPNSKGMTGDNYVCAELRQYIIVQALNLILKRKAIYLDHE